VPVAGPVPPPISVVMPALIASPTSCGQMKWMWLSSPPAVTMRPSPAMTSVDAPTTIVGDTLQFVGYGTIAQGATFRQLDTTHWEIASADGSVRDIITLAGAPTIDASDFAFV